MIFKKVLQPNRWILLCMPPMSFAALVFIFEIQNTKSTLAYLVYCMSAFYTFYTMVISVLNLVKFRKLGSPILSAAKVLNFIAAMMSILGLQTAMISRFSENGEAYRK